MENSTKALYMVASLLVALMIIGLLVYTFNKLGGVQNEKDLIQQDEEISAFNLEFEAYNNPLMNGTDIISCVNKAINNNEKFVDGGRWSLGNNIGDEALVQVEVELGSKALTENVKAYHFDRAKNKDVEIVSFSDSDSVGKIMIYNIVKEYYPKKLPTFTELKGKTLAKIVKDGSKKTKQVNLLTLLEGRTKKEWSKNAVFNTDSDDSLYELLRYSNEMNISISLSDINKYQKKNSETEFTADQISYIVWETYVTDFKTRKFRCETIEYNETNGRVNYLKFKER